MRQLFILFVIVALAVPFTNAIGINPSSATIDFVPGASGAFDAKISNGLNREVGVDVEVSGNLAQYIDVELIGPQRISPRSHGRAEISYSLPEDIPPGTNKQHIQFTEEYFNQETGGIGARAAVIMTLNIWKPYPGRYAELSLAPTHVPQGQDTQVKYTIQSLGDQPVDGDLQIRILNPQGELQDILRDNDIYIEGDSQTELYLQIPSKDYPPGKYQLSGSYDYGVEVANAQKTLIIGTQSVDVLNVTRKYYKDQGINRYEVEVESLWNEPLTGVSAQLTLGSSTGATPAKNIAAFETQTLVGYWEADQQLEEANHTALVSVVFNGGEPVDRTFPVSVYNETPQPRVEEPSSNITIGTTDVLFFVITFLIIGYFMMHISKRRE